jgi:hypothetical protein
LKIIKDSSETLDTVQQMQPDFNPDQDCPLWLSEEWEYILLLSSEPQEEKIKVDYLDAIEHFERAQ